MANPIFVPDDGSSNATRAQTIDPSTGKPTREEKEVSVADLKKGVDFDDDESPGETDDRS